MTKILFVDDDAIIRRTLPGRIPWETYGWELMYTARDAMEALDYLKNHEPDIILTDIKMPGMTSIEMASIAMDYYPNLKFVFLSGYKDFEYAQQVLKLNAVDYLTKPFDNDQLTAALKKAEELYKKEQNVNYILNEKYPQIKRNYISRLMQEQFQQMDDSFFKAFDINLTNGLGIACFIEMRYGEPSSYDAIHASLEAYCTQLTARYKGSFFFCMDNLQIFMIYTNNDSLEPSSLYSQLSLLEAEITSYIQGVLGYEVAAFYHGSIMNNFYGLYGSYQAALQDMNSNLNNLLLSVRHYIEQNYGDCDLSLQQIAAHFHVNHCYLTSIFKKQFDTNLYDYLIKIRMEKAAEMIVNTDLKNYEIAAATGYKNPQYFSLSFKKYYNCTITQYREKLRSEQT